MLFQKESYMTMLEKILTFTKIMTVYTSTLVSKIFRKLSTVNTKLAEPRYIILKLPPRSKPYGKMTEPKYREYAG